MYTVNFAGVEITAEWDVDCWYLEHVPYVFRDRVARLLDAEADRQADYEAEYMATAYAPRRF